MSPPPSDSTHTSAKERTLIERLRRAGCVFAEDEAALLLAQADGSELEALVARRVGGEPLESVLGWAQFGAIRIEVGPGVFVPRRRSELLVTASLDVLGDAATVIDLCCGSGAIGAAILASRPELQLYASDIDETAVAVARRNLEPRGAHVYRGDLFDAFPRPLCGRIDLIVVNAPYVPSGEIAFMPPEARDWEPAIALDGGGDGLDVHRRIAAEARRWLAPGGHLLIETSERQASEDLRMFTEAGFDARIVRDDDLDATIVVGLVVSTGVGTKKLQTNHTG